MLLHSELYLRMLELLTAADQERQEKEAWRELARKARDEWAGENAY